MFGSDHRQKKIGVDSYFNQGVEESAIKSELQPGVIYENELTIEISRSYMSLSLAPYSHFLMNFCHDLDYPATPITTHVDLCTLNLLRHYPKP